MVQFYAEVQRGVGLRDHNFKPIINNDPATTTSSWFGDVGFGGTINSDGDILTITGTDATHGVYKNFGQGLSTTTYPYLIIRGKADVARSIDVQVRFVGPTTSTFTINLTNNFQVFTITLPSAKTLTQTVTVKFINQSSSGSNIFDYVFICQNTPLQLSQKDLISGAVTKTALGVDHAEFLMNNWRGKFMTTPNNIGFGDHLHVYLGQGATAFHVYGGYAELKEPVMPNDEIVINSRGYGLALLRSRVLNIYGAVSGGTQPTPQDIFNDMVDTWINNPAKNFLQDIGPSTIPSNYQLTRSYVQNLGSSIPLYVTNLNYAYNSMREIADITVGQGSPGMFFVDPAENLHFVPLGAQGVANWGTDPLPALYGGSIAYGQNLVTTRLGYDSKSLANRVHYYGIAQIPGMVDGITEYATNAAFQADWNYGELTHDGGVSTGSLSTVTSPIAVGTHSNDFHVATGTNFGCGGTVYYTFPTALDITKMGSQWTPPILEFYIRFHGTGASSTHDFGPTLIYFGEGTPFTNHFNYRLQNSIPGAQDGILMIDKPQQDYWYHVLVPIGPNAGNLFLAAPTPNMIAQPTLLTAPWLAPNTGTPHWTSIKYIGFTANYSTTDAAGTLDIYIDGLRIITPRYRLAFDSRTLAGGRYADMSEQYFFDPVSKDETAITNFAKAELLRLRNPILRGTIVTTLLGDLLPEQQVKCTIPSANLSNSYLRCTQVTHRFSQNGALTEATVSNDFGNSQPLDLWKLSNVLLQMGENAIFSRELLDLRSAILDPTFTPIVDGYS